MKGTDELRAATTAADARRRGLERLQAAPEEV